MRKPSRRPAAEPAGGGALPRVPQPRGGNGQFIKRSEAADPLPPPEPVAVDKPAPRKRAATPEQLVMRVTRAIERELTQIENIVGPTGTSARARTESDKRARTLASLARTLAEVQRLRSTANEAKPDDDDAVPRDLDEFRRTLQRRLAQIVDLREVVSDRGDDAT